MSSVAARCVFLGPEKESKPTVSSASTSSPGLRQSQRRRKHPMWSDYDHPRFLGPIPDDLVACDQLHQRIMCKDAEPFTFYFYYPVDADALGLVDYHDIITQPIDLRTMRIKLDYRQYGNADEFLADIALMLDNCFKYNPPHDLVHQAGKQLQDFIKEQWTRICAAKALNNNNNKTITALASRPESLNDYTKSMDHWEQRRKDWLQRSAALRSELMALAPGAMVPVWLEKKLEKLLAEDAEKQPKKVASKKKKKAPGTYRRGNKGQQLTMDEMSELQRGISALPGNGLLQLVELIDKLEGSNLAAKSREIDLDPSSLKPSTMRAMLLHVRSWKCSSSHLENLSESSSDDEAPAD
ncbi:unnamed protein product, partial [Mesorhabditis spiculigera]